MIKLLSLVIFCGIFIVHAQSLDSNFQEASQVYDIPVQVLQAISYAETRGEHILNDQNSHLSCIAIPHVYGVMGIRNDDWFGYSVKKASQLTGYNVQEIMTDTRINILAAAALINQIANEQQINRSVLNNWKNVTEAYSGIRQSKIRELYSYELFRVMKEGYISERLTISPDSNIDLNIFSDFVKPGNGPQYIESEDYGPAVWDPSPNYTNNNISHQFSVVHTTQGGFAGSVSWLKNPAANASSHYVIRSSDGYIVQLVREQNKAWHAVCWNGYSLGVEHEGFVDNPAWYTDEMYIASANLFNHFATKFNIPFDLNRIIGHNQWQNSAWRTWMSTNYPNVDPTCNSHTDPGINWDWPFYLQLVSKDTTSPVITGYQPSISTDSVWANASIKVKFSQRMIKSITQAAFSITPSVPGIFTWEDYGRTMVFKPTSLYQLGEVYNVAVDTTAVNFNSKNILGSVAFSFITRSTAPLNVLQTYPAVNQSGLSTTLKFILHFDTPLLQSSINANIKVLDFNNSAIPIKNIQYFENEGRGSVTFSTLSPLLFSSDYTLLIEEGIQNIIGTSLGSTQNINFKTTDSIYVAGTLIDDFELIKNWKDPDYSGSTSGTDPNLTTFTISNAEKFAGSFSGKINYVFTGPAGLCRTFNADKPSVGSNVNLTFGLWIYGDMSNNFLEYWFYYNSSTNVIVKVDTLDWTGWKWVEIPISSITGTGDKLFHSVVIKQSTNGSKIGAIYIDNALKRDPTLTNSNEGESSQIPQVYELHQNYPNPFNPETIISFSLPMSSPIDLTIYDILGNKIADIVENTVLEAGKHSYRISLSQLHLSSGIYFYRLKAGTLILNKKMTVLK